MTALPRLLVAFAAACSFAAQAHSFKIAEITIDHPYARATAPGQPSGGAFLRLDNRGPADRLVAVQSGVAGSTELHEMKMEGDVMRMRQIDAVELPRNQSVSLQAGGLHIMLMGLKAPLKEGDKFPLTLRFQNAGEVKVEVYVEAVRPGEPMRHDMKH
jgi:periplasmic copper chaperone A